MDIKAVHNGVTAEFTEKTRNTFLPGVMKLFAAWVEAGKIHQLLVDDETMEEGITEEPLLRSELEEILENPLELWLEEYGGDIEIETPLNEFIEETISQQNSLSEAELEALWDDDEWVDFFLYIEEILLEEIGKISAKAAYEQYGTLRDPLSAAEPDPPELLELNQLVKEVIEAIETIPGDKVITFTGMEDGEHFSGNIDCSKEGKWGYEPEDFKMFQDVLFYLAHHSGSVVIRQFLNIKVERESADGEKMWVPKKNIYGLVLEDHSWFPVPKEDLLAAYSIDHETGEPITPDRDLIFCNFPV